MSNVPIFCIQAEYLVCGLVGGGGGIQRWASKASNVPIFCIRAGYLVCGLVGCGGVYRGGHLKCQMFQYSASGLGN